MSSLLLGLLLFQVAGSPPDSRGAIRAATRVVERDSAGIARRQWEAQLQQEPGNRHARLALGTLARLEYAYALAEQTYRPLIESQSTDLYSVHARLGRAEARRVYSSLDSAEADFVLAYRQARSLGDRPTQVEALIGLALVTARIAPADSALRLYREAERLLPPSEPELSARLRCARGPLLVASGKPGGKEDAEAGLAQARRARDDRLVGTCWLAIGAWTFMNVDDPAASAPPFDSAETYQQRSRDVAGAAESRAWSGYDHFSFFNNGPALADLDAAIALAHRSGNRYVEAWALRIKGAVQWRTGNFPDATRSLSSAATTARDLGDKLELMHIRRMMGNVAFGQGRLAEADAAFREALPVADRIGEVAAVSTIMHGISWLSAARGDWSGADREYRRTIAFMEGHQLQGLIPGMRYSGGVFALRNGALDQAEAAFRWYLGNSSATEYAGRYQSRARLAEIHWRRGHLDSAVAELTRASDHLDSLRATLQDEGLRTLAFQTSGGKYEEPDYGFATMIAAFVRAGRTEAAFRLAEHRRARDLSDRLLRARAPPVSSQAASSPASLAAETAFRSPDDSTAVIEYIAGRWGQPTTIFILVGDRITGHVLPSMDSLGPRVQRFIGLIEAGENAGPLGETLRGALLDSALVGLPARTRRLVIVPDDVLHRLPFDALTENGLPLLRRYAISVAPSATIALSLSARPSRAATGSLLVLGDPAFPTATPDVKASGYRQAFDQSGGLPALPFAMREAKAVGRFDANAEVRLGAMASEHDLKSRSLVGISVLHLATHAVVDDWTPDRTALALSPGGGEDGFLSPGEILELTLAADLVVLSACRTAAGPVIRGEGVQGLTAPLIASGARSVLATHWAIRDEAALRLVRQLYAGLARGLPVVEALRQAKLDAIERGAPPRDWAAFTVVGDPLVRIPLQSPREVPKWWLIAGGLSVLVGGWAGLRYHRLKTHDS